MKNAVFLLGIVLQSCNNSQNSTESIEPVTTLGESQNTFDELLIGNWTRVNNGAKERTFETWKKTEEGFSGLGFTLVGQDTVFKEILALVETDGHKYLDVRGVNPDPTLFKFIEESESHFVCVNDSNDFPKRIEYQIETDKMTAIISADDQMVEFLFERIK